MKTRNLFITIALAALFALPVAAADAPHDCAAHCATHTDKDAKMCVDHCKSNTGVEHNCAKHCATEVSGKDNACALHCAK